MSFDPDEATLKVAAEVLGANRIVWGSDYPHGAAFYPGFVDMLNKNIASIPEAAQERIRGLNAAELYDLQA